MRGSNRHITKGMTEDLIVGDWEFGQYQPRCINCGRKISKLNSLCAECKRELDAEEALQRLADEQDFKRGSGMHKELLVLGLEADILRAMGVEPPRKAVEQMDDAYLYGLDNDGLDYWD